MRKRSGSFSRTFLRRRTSGRSGGYGRGTCIASTISLQWQRYSGPERCLAAVNANAEASGTAIKRTRRSSRIPSICIDLSGCSFAQEHRLNTGWRAFIHSLKWKKTLARTVRFRCSWCLVQLKYSHERTLSSPTVVRHESKNTHQGRTLTSCVPSRSGRSITMEEWAAMHARSLFDVTPRFSYRLPSISTACFTSYVAKTPSVERSFTSSGRTPHDGRIGFALSGLARISSSDEECLSRKSHSYVTASKFGTRNIVESSKCHVGCGTMSPRK